MNRIITISREFGSGGRELGRRMADRLGFAYYDQEIVKAVSEKSGLAEQYVQSISEKQFVTYPIHYGRTFDFEPLPEGNYTRMLSAQQQILREMAQRSDCVIVGRCADRVLESWGPFSLFVYADMPSRLRRCRAAGGSGTELSDAELEKRIRRIDSQRARYRQLFSDRKWGAREDHALCVNTSGWDMEALAVLLSDYALGWFQSRNV